MFVGGIGLIVGVAVACGGGDDNNGGTTDGGSGDDASTGKDSSFGSDGSTRDSGGGSDAAPDSGGLVCTSSPCVTQIALGGDFSCALISDKTVRCWGENNYGQLAVGSTDNDGGFDAAPYSKPNPITTFTGIDEIAAADFHGLNGWACARAGTADVRCWGSDIYAMLGRGDASTMLPTPNPLPGKVVGLPGAIFLSGSGGHTCAVVPGGRVSCWGDSAADALGRVSSFTYDPYADFIEGGTANYVEVATGEAQSCAVSQTGAVDCWGWNSTGQLGRPDANVGSDLVPTTLPGLTGVVDMIGGRNFYCARTAAGVVDCWGENNSGELGRGDELTDFAGPTPVTLPAGKKARLIGASDHTGCAVLDDDTIWCWGANDVGQLGSFDGAAADPTPRQVLGITGKPLQIAGGQSHLCVLLEGGSVECWGSNSFGQLGRGAGDGGDPDSNPHPNPALVAF